jgi:alpha-tubulin suppressor-like RCC1 family protein
MRKVSSWVRRPCVARIGIFLLAVALIVGMGSCTGGGVVRFDLTISSIGGGYVTIPGEGTFTYNQGTVVNLKATPDPGFRFVVWTGDVSHVANVNAAVTTITMNGDYEITANFEYKPMVAAGLGHTVGLKSDGTAIAAGYNGEGQCNVTGWPAVIQVAASYGHTVGLRSDGTVVAVGWNAWGQCEVGNWTGITQVVAGASHTVGLKSGGTVVAIGWNDFGQCDVDDWTGIIQIAAGYGHTVGL